MDPCCLTGPESQFGSASPSSASPPALATMFEADALCPCWPKSRAFNPTPVFVEPRKQNLGKGDLEDGHKPRI